MRVLTWIRHARGIAEAEIVESVGHVAAPRKAYAVKVIVAKLIVNLVVFGAEEAIAVVEVGFGVASIIVEKVRGGRIPCFCQV